MASTVPPSDRPSSELKGQAKVIHEVKRLVDGWRGFELGAAREPYPDIEPRYQPASESDRAVTETSLTLLRHWFRREPHVLESSSGSSLFRYWPHQRRLVETFVYLYEVRRVRRTEQLYELAGVESLGPQRDPWAKLGGQLATGSGKTKMMSLLIAWAYLNALLEPTSGLEFGQHSLLIAPGLFVRDRLFQDFAPPRGRPSVFWADPVVPPQFESTWNLKVYSPDDCPRELDPAEGALVITNYHQLLRVRDDAPDLRPLKSGNRQLDLIFEDQEPTRLEGVQTPLLERFNRSKGLLVLNDEAHHVWDETGHSKFEQKAEDLAKLAGEDAKAAMAWIRCLRRLNGDQAGGGRLALQVDLSATLFEEQGSQKKGSKGKGQKTEFKPADLFRHATVHYGLAEAIKDGIVKKPVLERVVVKKKKTGEAEPLIYTDQANAWATYRNLLVTGIERWKKVRQQLLDEGDFRKPLLFVLCSDRNEAREVANYLTYGEARRDDLSERIPTGYVDHTTGETLFLQPDVDGVARSTVIEIHIGQKEESNEAEWEKVRQAVNSIDADVVPDPGGARDARGRPVMIPNPYNVIISVMMLKEGWDVRNVKVIVPLRPCDSKTLTEQTLGRGLRKMHAPILDDEGAANLRTEDLFVIEHPSFRALIDQIQDIMDLKSSDEIEHAREYVPIQQNADEDARREADVRLVRFEGLIAEQKDWRAQIDPAKFPPLVPKLVWEAEISESEIQTYLKKALDRGEEEGQVFTLPANPSYRDFDQVIELAFALPLLRELRASYQHKTAVKEVVRIFLETKTFALPAGLPLSFDKVLEAGDARIALANLARPEVTDQVRKALLPQLRSAFNVERPTTRAELSERGAAELRDYQALKKHVLSGLKKSSFTAAAFDSAEELRVATLLDRASDVVGWVYNHRSGVGYHIDYDWHGYSARYFPDFIARAKFGEVFHNFIIEVKGRMDQRDLAKARRGREYCDLLTQHDVEPWHYLLLLENPSEDRLDITWWAERSTHELAHVLKHHEGQSFLPDRGSQPPTASKLRIIENVSEAEQYETAVPVYDLAIAAGAFSGSQAPEPAGWAKVQSGRRLHRRMFVARVEGHSMESGIPDGSWGLFRTWESAATPSPTALDGCRVVVQLRDASDPETGGQYTLKRLKVTKQGADGTVEEVELRPDNPEYKVRKLRAKDGEVRVVAEFLEVVG